MPDSSQRATTTSQARPRGPSSAATSGGAYWPLLWHAESPGEVIRGAVAQDMEEKAKIVMTSTPLVDRERPVDLANTASVIRAVERIQRETGVTALGQYFTPRHNLSRPLLIKYLKMLFLLCSEPQQAVRQSATNLGPGWTAMAVGSGVAALGLALGGAWRALGWILGRPGGETPTDNRIEVVVSQDSKKPEQSHLKPLARNLTPELEAARDEDKASLGSDYQDAE